MTEGRPRNFATHHSASSNVEAAGSIEPSLHKKLHNLRFERVNHTLQPTALVNEAYLRLAQISTPLCQDRPRFLAVAARVIRHILVDHARSHGVGKGRAGAFQVILDDNLVSTQDQTADVLAVDEALERLAKFDPRQAEILEMYFFAGMTFEEIDEVLGVSLRTVQRDWTMARAWLHQELSPKR